MSIRIRFAVCFSIVAVLIVSTPGATAAASLSSHCTFAPSSRILSPTRVLRTEGSVRAASAFLANRSTRLDGGGALVVVDFGREVAGTVQIHFTGSSSPTVHVGLAFSESSLYTGRNSDASNGATSAGMFTASAESTDGALDIPVLGAKSYTMPSDKVRLGFRYLTVFLSTAGRVTFDRIRLDFSAAPTMRTIRESTP